MTLRDLHAAVLAVVGIGLAPSLCAAQCPVPMVTDKTPTLTVMPMQGRQVETPHVGDLLTVTLSLPQETPRPKDSTIATVVACFDDIPAMAVADSKDPNVQHVTVPPTATTKSGVLPGDHRLTMSWEYKVNDAVVLSATGQRAIMFKPALTAIRVLPVTKDDHSYRVMLTGDGFDQANPMNTLIVTESGIHDVCWSGQATCTASPRTIRATLEGPNAILLENVDPIEEATEQFKVCYREASEARCSQMVSDAAGEPRHWKVIGASAGVLLAICALIVFLVLISRSVFIIWGERYVLSVLLLDKETDTYSLSKLQFYIWTAVAVFGYAYLTISRFWVQGWHELPPIPPGLPGIVGISAGAAVGAQVVTQINGPKGAGKLRPSLSDLITTGDVVVPERVQFLVWTLIGAAGFFFAVANLDPRTIVDLPDVPQSILAISGISAFGYLGGKLARNGGPVINEVIIRTGPDPDVVPPVTQATGAVTPVPAWLQTIQAAIADITKAHQQLGSTTPKPELAGVLTPAHTAGEAATAAMNDAAKLSGASTAADLAAAKTSIAKRVTDSAAGADAAAKALEVMAGANTAAGDFAAAGPIVQSAQNAAAAVQKIQAALLTAVPAPPTASSATQFGLIDLRGRMLSQDATFKISQNEDIGANDFQLAFDQLEPSPRDNMHLQKPRVVERDPDSNDATMAKRLLLVVRLNAATTPFFEEKKTHTLTVINPDSQKVVFKYTVPETQKPS